MGSRMIRSKYSTRHRIDQPSENSEPDRITCAVCGFPGVDIDTEPGGEFPTSFTVTDSTYVWTNTDDPISGLDKSVLPVPNPSVSCPFCGATRFLDGNKGSGNAIP